MIPLQLLKKYRASTSSLCAAQAEAREVASRADAALEEARSAKDKLAELTARLAHAEAGHSQGHAEAERRLELRNKVTFTHRSENSSLGYSQLRITPGDCFFSLTNRQLIQPPKVVLRVDKDDYKCCIS